MGLQSRTRLKRLSMPACIGEGNGNPLQYFCLENPRDRGAWWAAVYRVTQSQTRLKWITCGSSRFIWLLQTRSSHWYSDVSGTMNTPHSLSSVGPYFSASERNYKAFCRNELQKGGTEFLSQEVAIVEPGPPCWWWTVCPLSSLACIFSPWGFDFASPPVKNWSSSLGPLKLARPGVWGRSGGDAEGRAGSSLAVSSGSCEHTWSSLWLKDGQEGDRQGPTGEGIPKHPACSGPQTHEGTKPRPEEPPSWTHGVVISHWILGWFVYRSFTDTWGLHPKPESIS